MRPSASSPFGISISASTSAIGATSGLSATMQAERDKYAVPEQEKYTGPLSRFKYDPSTYNPDIVRPPNPPYRAVYAAEGGIMSLAPNGYAMGGMPPQTNFANPSQSMIFTSVKNSSGEAVEFLIFIFSCRGFTFDELSLMGVVTTEVIFMRPDPSGIRVESGVFMVASLIVSS